MDMKVSCFREFLVLAKYLNFSLAADHLHMTQSGLSRHISALENELGVKLFERDTHRVGLTEKGQHFLRGIGKIVEDYDFLCESIQTGGLEKITIGVPYFGVNRYLSPIMTPFEDAFPEVKISYLPAYPDAIIAGLLSKQVDVAVRPKVNFRGTSNLIFHDAFNEPVVLLLHRKHPLANTGGVHIADLEGEKFITLKGNFGDALFESWYELCRQHKLRLPKTTLGTMTIEEAALSMKPGSGVMLLPGHLKEANIAKGITCIDLLDEDCCLTIGLAHHPQNSNPVIEEFIDFYLSNIHATPGSTASAKQKN
jgi:DNA-binding transcriptional LysR family regulator